jgi:hypothetical protein
MYFMYYTHLRSLSAFGGIADTAGLAAARPPSRMTHNRHHIQSSTWCLLWRAAHILPM